MLPGSDGVASVIRVRVDELETYGAAAARPLIEEEDLLLRTVSWYRERGGENTMVDAANARLKAVRDELEHVLPLWEEAQLLERVLRLYDRQRLGELDPGRLRILRNQVRHQMEIERRHAVPPRGLGAPGNDRPNQWSPGEQSSVPVRREHPPEDDDGDETAIERTARSRTVQERVGLFAREYLDMTRVAEVPFTTLYEAVVDYAAREWPNSTDRARVENFRYALRRAAPLYGLIYEQGRVRRAEFSGQGVVQ